MTVTSIVQNLLEKGHITAEEALVLLKAEISLTPCCSPPPYNPPSPCSLPAHPGQPGIWCTTVAAPSGTERSQQSHLGKIFTSK